MPRPKRIGRNFIHFCPCPLPSAPRYRLAPRLVTSLRTTLPVSPPTAPRLLQPRLFLQAAHLRPWKTERNRAPGPGRAVVKRGREVRERGNRCARMPEGGGDGGGGGYEFGSEGKMNIFLSSRYLILRFSS